MLTLKCFKEKHAGKFSKLTSDELLFINAGSSSYNPSKSIMVTQSHTSQGGTASLTFQTTPSKGGNWVTTPDNNTIGYYNENRWDGGTERHETWYFYDGPRAPVATGLRG